jgi:small subunit ribosomal protein S4
MKRKHKTYSRPKRPFDKTRIEEEKEVKKRFGLKNKREIWKAEAQIKSMREKAKKLISAEESKQHSLFQQLNKIGIKVSSIANVLGLEKEDYLSRRLQTIVFKKNLAPTINAARQMIIHKKVLVDGRIINKPSYIVPVILEEKITIKSPKKKIKKESPNKEKEIDAETEETKIEEKENE